MGSEKAFNTLTSLSKSTLNQRSEEGPVESCNLDQEEFLYLLNLYISNQVKNWREDFGEQPWLNEVYRYEKFDIGSEYNLLVYMVIYYGDWISKLNIPSNIYSNIDNATVVQFAGSSKINDCQEPVLKFCNKWKDYKRKLLL